MSDVRSIGVDEEQEVPRGFVSAEDKRKVLTATGVLTGIVVFLQLVVPIVATILAMLSSGFGELYETPPERAAWWKDGLWLIKSKAAHGYRERSEARLLRWAGGDEDPLVEMATFGAVDPWLLPTADVLWITSPELVGTISRSGIEFERVAAPDGLVSPPFLWDGRPAMLVELPGGRELLRFEADEWRSTGPIDLGVDASRAYVEDLRVVGEAGAETLVSFVDAQLLATPQAARCLSGKCPDRWDVVLGETRSAAFFGAAAIDGRPVIFASLAKGLDAEIVGLERGDRGWERFVELEFGLPGRIGVVPTDAPGRYLVLCQGFPGSLTVFDIVGGRSARKVKLGEELAPPGTVMLASYGSTALGWVLALLMGLLLTPIMRRRKVTVHRTKDEARSAPYASLARRGLAAGVDLLISGGPMIAGWLMFMGVFVEMEQSPLTGMLDAAGVLAIGVLFGLACFFLFSYLEGRYGKTPGKWLLGIRVRSLELEPCGFGRALVRNVLMVADGMFSCVVGVLLIAITPSWQRVGDLAGRTVVVRDTPGTIES